MPSVRGNQMEKDGVERDSNLKWWQLKYATSADFTKTFGHIIRASSTALERAPSEGLVIWSCISVKIILPLLFLRVKQASWFPEKIFECFYLWKNNSLKAQLTTCILMPSAVSNPSSFACNSWSVQETQAEHSILITFMSMLRLYHHYSFKRISILLS